jgi:membrane fusion protein (multidrug efflux system)
LRAYLVAIGLLLLFVGGTGAYVVQRISAQAGGDYAPPPVSIAAATAREHVWRETIAAVGTIRAAQGILLTAETTGDITAIHVDSGDEVVAGQPLIAIDEALDVATRQRLEARLTLARQLFDRDARLIKENSIPESQFDRSRADLESAQAELAEIDATLKNKRISAPFAGRLGILQVRLGDYVEAGTALVNLQDVSRLEVDFSVPDRYAPFMRPGLTLTLRTAAFPEKTFSATLRAVDSQVDENTRNLLLRAEIDGGEGLLPGMFARLSIDLNRESRRVFVPETAVTYSLQGDLVYLIEEDEQGLFVTPRVVTVLSADQGEVAIAQGIRDGDRIVTAGQNKLYRGARVQIDPDAGI